MFSWRARERKYSKSCVCSVMTSKRKATASLASDNVREHAAVRVGSGRLRENAVPRHQHATCLMLITVRSQNMCRTCCTSTWARTNAHHASSLMFLSPLPPPPPPPSQLLYAHQHIPSVAKFVAEEHTCILANFSFDVSPNA